MNNRNAVFPKALQLSAQHSQRATGVPACVSLAQWALESNYGKSMSGTNNPFGIKGDQYNGTLCPTWEVINGKSIKTHAWFRNFPSIEAAFDHHGRMLMHPKGYYTAAHPYAHSETWEKFLRAIAGVYATDPAYAAKLVGIVKEWHLYDFNLPT